MAKQPKSLLLTGPLRPSILMVTDDQAFHSSLQIILKDPFYDLTGVRSGEQALEQLNFKAFAAILLDVRLPGMSGFDTAKRILTGERSRHTPVIFLSSEAIEPDVLETGYAMGAIDFFTRPLSPVIVRAKVGALVSMFLEKERAEQASEQLRLIVQGSIDYAIFMLDPKGRVASWNPGAARLKGYRAEEIIGQHFSQFYPKEVIDRGWPDNELKVAAAHGRFEDEGWRLRKDGSRFWANVVITAIKDDHGTLLGFSKITRDLTARKEAEETARRLVEEAAARRAAEENARLVQQDRELLHVTLSSIGDAVITTDHEGRITFLNQVAEALVGWRSENAVGQALPDVFHIVNESTRLPVENPALRALEQGVIVGLANHTVLISNDGTERPIDDSAAPIRDASGRIVGSVLVFRDISERKRVEQQRDARLAVTQLLGQSLSVDDAVGGVLQAICEGLAWDVGFFWTVNESDSAIHCLKSWHNRGAMVEGFESASCSRTFEKGQGLPGRVWESRKPSWILDIKDDPNFPRLSAAVQHGLHSAFAFPIAVGDRTLGVIEFFTKRIREPDADLLEMMGTIAGNVGQFIERKLAEERLRQSERELADFFENATVGLHWVGPDGTILRANQAELDMLGYNWDEYVGHPIADFHVDENVICDILNRLRDGQRLAEYPARLRCKDGSIKEVLIDSSVLWLDEEFIHTRCFTRDVTERKRAEAKIREQEQRTRHLLESITDAFFGLDRDWRFSYINRQAEALLGRSRDTLVGRVLWEEYPDILGTQIETNYKRALIENVTVAFDFFYEPHDRWYDVKASPSTEGLLVFFQDVSDRKQAEIALRESESRFRQLADAMPQIVWTARPDGQIDYLNRRWTEFTGQSQAVGNEGWSRILHPDDARAAHDRWAASLDSGNAFGMEVRLLDHQRQAYRWHLIRTVAAKDEAGKVVRWFGTSTDIHEQKRAEESAHFLAQASAELAVVIDCESTLQKVANLAVPYFADWSAVDLANDDGSLRRLAVSHQDPDKVSLVHSIMQEYPPDPNSPTGAMAVARTGRPEFIAEITDEVLVRSAKDQRHLRLIRSLGLKSYICVPLLISGKAIGVMTFATAESGRSYTEGDLALAIALAQRAAVAVENTQLYQALRDADRRKDEFLATLAHELRNPLAPIRNALQILKMPRIDAETVERSREMMDRQVHHLVRLVDDLLDVSRVMRGKIELRKEPTELAIVVARSVETVQPLVDAQGHYLSIQLPEQPLPIDADPVRLAQVIGNLLTNAAKYTEPGGSIRLTAARDGDMAVLKVQDSGIGIAPDMLPRIFELFVQVDHASTKAQGGLGIGLTLVKNLVEMHNGKVEARSAGLGKGSEFVVLLPLLASAPDRNKSADTKQLSGESPLPSGYRVLVVDDNQDAANSLAMLLKLHGHEVHVAYSGTAAVEMTKVCSPDVVFLDIGMPGMDGYEVARRLRQQPGLQNALLAALTGWGQQEDRRRTAEAGFNHHLVKPPEAEAIECVFAELKRRTQR